MNTGGSDDGYMSDINVTPFVDVMLVLLIIFMVAAPMMIQGVDVSLPEASSETLPTKDEYLLITINAKNEIYINDIKVAVDFLEKKLVMILKNRKSKEVYLKADKDIPYGIVVRVMYDIKGAGVEKLGMVTIPISEEKKKTD